jgi:RNA polymerase sigma-70 factor, ECF subfamily
MAAGDDTQPATSRDEIAMLQSPVMDELVRTYWSGQRDEVRAELAAALAGVCAHVREQDPRVEDREVAEALAAKCPSDDVLAYIASCYAFDLLVSQRAARGDAAAIARIEQAHRAVIDATCRRFVSSDHGIDDLRQILREKLFAGSPAAVAQYDGRGRLGSWLRVMATRLFIDLRKRKDRGREVADLNDRAQQLPDPADLGLDLIKAEYRAATRAAIEHAAQELSPGDRLLLRQHLVAGLTIDELGVALGIHRASAARRIAKARDQLVAATRAELTAKLALSPRELDELLGMVASRIDLSITRLLATRA